MGNLRPIFNGDDFGRALSINAAIIRAHGQGVLTSASLMVTGDAVDDAVARAREHPTLAVGLHVALMGARGALSNVQVRRISTSVRSAELYFHHCTQAMGEPYGANPGDLAALLSPRVRCAIQVRGAQLTSYAGLVACGSGARATPGDEAFRSTRRSLRVR